MKAFGWVITGIIVCVLVIIFSLNSLYKKNVAPNMPGFISAQKVLDENDRPSYEPETDFGQKPLNNIQEETQTYTIMISEEPAQKTSALDPSDIPASIKKAMEDNPKNLNAAILIASNLFLESGQYATALDIFNKAVSVQPDNPAAYLFRGIAYFALEDTDKAEQDFNKASSLNPDYLLSGFVFYNKGVVNLNHGKNNLAILDFSKAASQFNMYTDGKADMGSSMSAISMIQEYNRTKKTDNPSAIAPKDVISIKIPNKLAENIIRVAVADF